MSGSEVCMSCGQDFAATGMQRTECRCHGCDALRIIANLEGEPPEELRIGSQDLCMWTPEDAEYQGCRRGRAIAAQIARNAFDDMRLAASIKYGER